MVHSLYWMSFAGGLLIGIAALLLLLVGGKIAGISGILAGALSRPSWTTQWHDYFIVGLILGGMLPFYLAGPLFAVQPSIHPGVATLAGLLVGIGTRLAKGCTSGHGICGVGRLSPRSLVATLTFMLMGMLTVYLMRHVW